MAKLTNSTRSVQHAVYTPLHIERGADHRDGKPWPKRALLAALAPAEAEIAALRAQFRKDHEQEALAVLAVADARRAAPGALDDVAAFAKLDARAVGVVARALIAL